MTPATLITDQSEFESLCEEILEDGCVAFDTEFVSEFTYRPELCLLQFATSQREVAVDPYEVKDLTSWWDIMTNEETLVVIHGGREEIRFCLHATGQLPCNIVDVQLTEGLLSCGFPLSYQALVQRVVNQRLSGKETRTDWRRRPLSDRQLEYALEDVIHLSQILESQNQRLEELGRADWVEVETQRFMDDIQTAEETESWLRVSGIHKLNTSERAVIRELANWRDKEAQESNKPMRRVMRDDLIIELARRKPKTARDLSATRGMEQSRYKKYTDQLLECIKLGLEIPKDQCPELPEGVRQRRKSEEHTLGRLLGVALTNRCAEADVSMSLVGTTADLRDFVRWHTETKKSEPLPKLASGWRGEVCGNLLGDLLDGRITIRVADPGSDHPLIFESIE